MKRKWIFLTGVILFLCAFVAVSAASEQGTENAQERSRLEHLDLTDEQKARLQALRKQHGRALRALRDTMAVLRERHREAVMDVLTDEQEAKLGPFDLQSELDVTPYSERIEAITESARNVGAAIGRWWDDMNDPEATQRVYSKLNLTNYDVLCGRSDPHRVSPLPPIYPLNSPIQSAISWGLGYSSIRIDLDLS